jgi:hypothetical protein
MQDSTKVRLIIVTEDSFNLWQEQYLFRVFLDEHDKSSCSSTQYLRASAASKSFPQVHICLTTTCEVTIAEVIEFSIRQSFSKLDSEDEVESGEDFIRDIEGKTVSIRGEYDEVIEYSLFCPALSSDILGLSSRIYELGFSDESEEIFVLKKNIVPPRISGSGLNIVRDYTHFQNDVVSRCNLERIDNYLYGQNFYNPSFLELPIAGVLLYTDEDFELSVYVRENFDNLHAMSGKDIEVFCIEEPPSNSINATPAFWKTRLEHFSYLTWSLLGWVRSKPYNKSEAYKIATSLGVYPDQLPCLVIFDETSCSDKIIISIPKNYSDSNNYSEFFRKTFSEVRRCLSAIKENISVTVEPKNSWERASFRRKRLFSELIVRVSQTRTSNKVDSEIKLPYSINVNFSYVEKADLVNNNPGGISQSNTGQMSGGMQANTGDNSQQTMVSGVDTNSMPTQLEVIEMLVKVQEIIQDSALSEIDKKKATTFLDAAKAEAEAEEPNKGLVAGNLERVTKTLKAADEALGTGASLVEKVAPTVKAIAPWLGKAVGSLLSFF